MIQAGDFVRVKSLKQLKKEFHCDPDGYIRCAGGFIPEMYKYCGLIGKVARVVEIAGFEHYVRIYFTMHNPILGLATDINSDENYFFSTQMVTKIRPISDWEDE